MEDGVRANAWYGLHLALQAGREAEGAGAALPSARLPAVAPDEAEAGVSALHEAQSLAPARPAPLALAPGSISWFALLRALEDASRDARRGEALLLALQLNRARLAAELRSGASTGVEDGAGAANAAGGGAQIAQAAHLLEAEAAIIRALRRIGFDEAGRSFALERLAAAPAGAGGNGDRARTGPDGERASP